MSQWTRPFSVPARLLLVALLLPLAVTVTVVPGADAAPEGTMTWAIHFTLAPKWLDPAETEAAITPFKVLYPIHDALVKLMPGGMTPSLAESWTMCANGVVPLLGTARGAAPEAPVTRRGW